MPINPSIPKIQNFLNLTLEIKGEGDMTMMLHNYRSRRFHRASNSINPSSGFRDMASTKSGPMLLYLRSFGPWASPYGANGQITMAVHNYKSRQVHKTLNGLNQSSGFRDLRSAKTGPNLCHIWQVFFCPWATFTTWGKWANDHDIAQLQAQTIPQNFNWRKSVKRLEIWVPQIWQPPAQTVTTIPLQPGGLGVKNI